MIRNHYIPRKYLKGFCNPDGKIYCFELANKKTICTSLQNVAHEKGLYSDDVERELARKIEEPANYLLDKLRNQQMIDPIDKPVLARYMIILMIRTPDAWNRAKKTIPKLGCVRKVG